MPLPTAWIDQIFNKLTMVYGHHFLGRWSGLDLNVIKGDWAHELDGFENHGESIKYALQHLPPDNPPTVLQFRELCRRAPAPVFKALPQPEVNQKVAQAALSKAAQITKPLNDRLKPIRTLMEREIAGGQGLTKAQREFWRVALRDWLLQKTGIDTSQPFTLSSLSAALNQREAA